MASSTNVYTVEQLLKSAMVRSTSMSTVDAFPPSIVAPKPKVLTVSPTGGAFFATTTGTTGLATVSLTSIMSLVPEVPISAVYSG